MERCSNKIAIAPTASISIITGESSPGIEPYTANVYVQKSLAGSFVVVNKNLQRLLEEKGMFNDDVLSEIATNEGSVQHLDFLSDFEKKVFKTAQEINQFYLIEHAADRTPYICQSQSLNLFLPASVDKKTLHQLHYLSWKKGVKTLYYCRSMSVFRADKITHKYNTVDIFAEENDADNEQAAKEVSISNSNKYEECLSCQ